MHPVLAAADAFDAVLKDAAADLRLARALEREHVVLAAGVRQGRVSTTQARVIVRALEELPAGVGRDVVELAEVRLVEFAGDFNPKDLRRLGRRILHTVAPQIAEDAEARALQRMEATARDKARLRIRACGDGTTRISAVIADASAARLVRYLHAFTNPRRDDGTPRTGADDQAAPTPAQRTPYPRRLAEAFCQLLETWDPARLPVHGGDATTVTVTISLEALRAELGTAVLDHGVPGDGLDQITAAQARRLACNAHLVPVVLGADDVVLNAGRARRLFDHHQRRALRLTHRTCRAEGCDIPASWCEAHHDDPWSRGGRTDLARAQLLCTHHHHRVHDPGYHTEKLPTGDIRFHRRN